MYPDMPFQVRYRTKPLRAKLAFVWLFPRVTLNMDIINVFIGKTLPTPVTLPPFLSSTCTCLSFLCGKVRTYREQLQEKTVCVRDLGFYLGEAFLLDHKAVALDDPFSWHRKRNSIRFIVLGFFFLQNSFVTLPK
jgi:hypothetical protein